MINRLVLLIAISLPLLAIASRGAVIINGGFETGDLTGWTLTGETENSFDSRVEGGDFTGASNWANQFEFFTPESMEGSYSFFSGFDGPIQEITLSQDIGVIDENTTAVSFDVRAGWDLETFAEQSGYSSIEDREIKVVITDNETGETLLSQSLFNAVGNEKNLDSGLQTVGINFQNIVGSDVTMSFVQNIPQAYTGPALIQLDDIQLQQTFIPEPSSFALLLAFGSFLYVAIKRRRNY
jgi:hypothetical protein